jgi:hypothetical protein
MKYCIDKYVEYNLRVELSDAVLAEVELAEGFEFLQEVDLDDVVVRGV